MRYHFTSTRMVNINEVNHTFVSRQIEQLDLSHIACESIKWELATLGTTGLLKVNRHLFHDTAIPLLDIYRKEIKIYVQTKMCSQTFIKA